MKSLKIPDIIREAIESRVSEIRRNLSDKRAFYLNKTKGQRRGKRRYSH
jgi:hypothetical protein